MKEADNSFPYVFSTKPLEKKVVSKKAVAGGSSSEAGSPGGKLGLLIRRLPSRSTGQTQYRLLH